MRECLQAFKAMPARQRSNNLARKRAGDFDRHFVANEPPLIGRRNTGAGTFGDRDERANDARRLTE